MVAGNGSGDSPGNDGSSLVRAPIRAAYSFADTDRAAIFPIRRRVVAGPLAVLVSCMRGGACVEQRGDDGRVSRPACCPVQWRSRSLISVVGVGTELDEGAHHRWVGGPPCRPVQWCSAVLISGVWICSCIHQCGDDRQLFVDGDSEAQRCLSVPSLAIGVGAGLGQGGDDLRVLLAGGGPVQCGPAVFFPVVRVGAAPEQRLRHLRIRVHHGCEPQRRFALVRDLVGITTGVDHHRDSLGVVSLVASVVQRGPTVLVRIVGVRAGVQQALDDFGLHVLLPLLVLNAAFRDGDPGPQGEAVIRSPEPSTAPLLRLPPCRRFSRPLPVSVPSPPRSLPAGVSLRPETAVPEVLDRLRPAGGRSEGRAVRRCGDGTSRACVARAAPRVVLRRCSERFRRLPRQRGCEPHRREQLPHASTPARLSRLPGLHACVAPYRRSMRTSRCSRPRTTVERRYRGSRPASVIRSNRAAALAMTALVSMRASSAPMHWCYGRCEVVVDRSV